jgi:hypothetical protein
MLSQPSWPGKSAKRVFALDVPAIHVLAANKKDVDARDKPGHDERESAALAFRIYLRTNLRITD